MTSDRFLFNTLSPNAFLNNKTIVPGPPDETWQHSKKDLTRYLLNLKSILLSVPCEKRVTSNSVRNWSSTFEKKQLFFFLGRFFYRYHRNDMFHLQSSWESLHCFPEHNHAAFISLAIKVLLFPFYRWENKNCGTSKRSQCWNACVSSW